MADAIVAFEGWGASGVAWGSQGWGIGHTDVTSAGAVGTVLVSVVANPTVQVTGIFGTMELGTVAVAIEAIVITTGVQALGLLGQINIWGQIDDSQNANWGTINDAQIAVWTQI